MHRSYASAVALLLTAAGLVAPAAAQVTLEGRLTDPAGVPVVFADIDLLDAETGTRIDLGDQDDNTDATGHYSIVVGPAIYHVRFEPPVTRDDLAPILERDFLLDTSRVLDAVLPSGRRLSGRVTGPDGAPVAGVDLDVVDPVNGQGIPTVRDDTDAGGFYGITVVPGLWNVEFSSALGSGVGPLRVDGVDLTADTVLDVRLPRGHSLSGRVVTEQGRGVFHTDVDARDRASRRPVPLSDDDSDFSGFFVVNVPEGNLDLFLTPPDGAPLAPIALYGRDVNADLDLGTLVLGAGVALDGTVRDPDGLPLAGADLDFFQVGSCDPYPVSGGWTDAAGTFAVRVAPGMYDVVVSAPAEAALAPYRFEALSFGADGSTELRIPTRDPQRVPVVAMVAAEDGAPVEGARVTGTPRGTGTAWEAITDSEGAFDTDSAAGIYRVTVEPADGSGFRSLTLETVDLPCGLPGVLTLATGPAVVPAIGTRIAGSPNPWRASTNITLALESPAREAVLEVYDLAGRRVRTLHRGSLPDGRSVFPWDGTNDAGHPVASGVYMVSLVSVGQRISGKIARIRP